MTSNYFGKSPDYYDYEYNIEDLASLLDDEEFNNLYPDVDKVFLTYDIDEADDDVGFEYRVTVYPTIMVNGEMIDVEPFLSLKDMKKLEDFVEESR